MEIITAGVYWGCPVCGRRLTVRGGDGRITDGRLLVYQLYCERCKCIRVNRIRRLDDE